MLLNIQQFNSPWVKNAKFTHCISSSYLRFSNNCKNIHCENNIYHRKMNYTMNGIQLFLNYEENHAIENDWILTKRLSITFMKL